MSSVKKELLLKHKVIEDVFNYQDFDSEIADVYACFENSFQELFEDYASLFNIKDYCFYIKSNDTCNAFASKREGYNIIGITNGYPILLKRKFDKEYFKNILLAGIINEKPLFEAYCDLEEDTDFDYSKFILDCSIKFTFNHEFEHILQLNSDLYNRDNYLLHENLEMTGFDIKKHVWEFDADRMASFEVLKYVFSVYKKLKAKNDEKLKCLLFVGCASMIITKSLFYFGVINQLEPKYSINKKDFYIKENSHPHPLVRCLNIIEYYFDNITEDFPRLKIEFQELLDNTIAIIKLYFDSLIPNQDIASHFLSDLEMYLDDINQYNQELYDFAIQDESIRNLLLFRNISFG
ncbi:hypothetical protein [Desulfotomaculum sp. 1211_IL3151]|uniref:hypothetical protein n=1 Tax=Desulfotomaculum sp. 1211_IL3151 TaxID=3084055 RepID=UPI002FDB8F4D